MGLEPTQLESYKILSLARLPVPTLPHSLPYDNHEIYHTIFNKDCQLFFLVF